MKLRLWLPRDKADTLLLMLSSLMVLAPHAAHFPLWITAAVACSLLWRATLTVRGKRLPPLWLLLPISLLAMAGVYRSFHTLLGREAGVAMLALLLAFKLLEMRAKRDLFVVIFLSFFLLLTTFFYSQSIATGLLMVVTVIMLLTAQLSFQYTAAVPPLARRLRLAASIFAGAAPLALLLFVAFPRIQGPLWSLPGDTHGGRTGMSDNMAPGNISNLAQSEETAFRVRFTDPAPPQNLLYWRGIVLSDYDGRTWTRGRQSRRNAYKINIESIGSSVRYQVTLEPSGQRWLFALDLPHQIEAMEHNNHSFSPALEAFATSAIDERLRYNASSAPEYRLQADETIEHMQAWLALPPGYNPRTLAWARLHQDPARPDAAIGAVLQWFRSDQFFYTLQAPLLGRNAVDEFLFDSKAGFCEHYAGAFVVLMRAMGIPARVVTGYQGGEMNPVDSYLTVRQSDAHAWAEVWLAGRGWQRVDPTAAVAPQRVEKNLARALPPSTPFGLQGLGEFMQRRDTLWSMLRFNWSAVNNHWNQWVLDYSPERQRGVLDEFGTAFGNWRSLGALIATGALLYLARRLRLRRRGDPLDALYLEFCRRMARRGCARAPHEGPRTYAGRLNTVPATAEQRAAMLGFLAIYGAMKYGVVDPGQRHAALRKLTRLLTLSR
ncbi:transglutaminase-like putative cysteine protease [Oxalobacteraceae bacterium GrIS 1.11]